MSLICWSRWIKVLRWWIGEVDHLFHFLMFKGTFIEKILSKEVSQIRTAITLLESHNPHLLHSEVVPLLHLNRMEWDLW